MNAVTLEPGQEGIITEIKRQKGNHKRFDIYVGGEFAFSVHEDIWVKHRLLKGTIVDREQVKEILAEEEKHRAMTDAVRFLARSKRSEAEVRRKLAEKGYSPDLIEHALTRLKQQNAIDDLDFARSLSDYRIRSQNKGKRWVQYELQNRGVDKEWIAEALEQISGDEEFEAAMNAARKKWDRLKDHGKAAREKTAAFLLRRGFSPSVVRRVIQELLTQSEHGI